MSAPSLPPEWVEIRFRECVPVAGQLGRVDSVETWKPFQVVSAADWDRGILVVCDDAGQSKQIKLDANHRMADRITASAPAPAQSQSRSSPMSAKHTQGPWIYGWGGGVLLVFDAKGGPTIAGIPYNDEKDSPLAEANARLIAAAPELLEALQLALKALEAIGEEMTVGDRYTNAGQYLLDSLNPARAAIAKATGQNAQA